MRRFLFLVLVTILMSCDTGTSPVIETPQEPATETPTTETPATEEPTTFVSDRPVWVKNRVWETVKTDALKASIRGSRVIDSLESLQEEIDAHNAASPENPWRIYVDTVPSIEDAPMCEMWIVDKETYALKTNPSDGTPYHLLVARTMVTGRIWAWESDAAQVNGRLYIDYPPPDEIPPVVHDEAYWYAYYSIYAVGSTGLIHYQIHITEEDWAAGGYLNRDNMFDQKLTYFQSICNSDGIGQPDSPWHVVARQLYTEPE